LKTRRINHCFIATLVLGLLFFTGIAHAGDPDRIGVLISRRISPYLTMVEGFRQGIDTPSTLFFINEKNGIETEQGDLVDLHSRDFSLLVAVGPEALSHLTSNRFQVPIVYGMVLDPDSVAERKYSVSGVSLNIFSLGQVDIVGSILPKVKRIGVLYNPANNSRWFTSAMFRGARKGVTLVPLAVSDRSQIAEVFEKNASSIDTLLFIPDSTVISRTIIRYVIKEGIYRGIPAIGYNRFFHESGAAFSFIIDYKEVGKQVADLARARLQGKAASSIGPKYKVLLNKKVVEHLGLEINKNLPEFAEFQ
jgi:putative ABC transport system substrate-binding protein